MKTTYSITEAQARFPALDLAGFCRLRVGRYRVVFWYQTRGRGEIIRCEYAEERSLIYQLFAQMARHLRLPPDG